MNALKVVLIAIMTLLLGCRNVTYYEYQPIDVDVENGVLTINVVGEFGEEYEVEGKKYLDWGAPYVLQLTYVVPADIDLSELIIRNITLVGDESNAVYTMPDMHSSTPRIYDREKLIRVSDSIPPIEPSHQNFILGARVVININGEQEERDISIHLKTKVRTERRSDKFDQIMSV